MNIFHRDDSSACKESSVIEKKNKYKRVKSDVKDYISADEIDEYLLSVLLHITHRH